MGSRKRSLSPLPLTCIMTIAILLINLLVPTGIGCIGVLEEFAWFFRVLVGLAV